MDLLKELGSDETQTEFDENALNEMAALSIHQKAAFGEGAGKGLRRLGEKKIDVDPEDNDPYSASIMGFSLNARVWVGGKDREKLEKLIRYMARGPIATERLEAPMSDLLTYKIKTPWKDGTTHVTFSPLDFIARLVALIPPPKMNLVRYHGVFAPNFGDRDLIVPAPKETKPVEMEHQKAAELETVADPFNQARVRRERLRWSDMLKRTFKIDVTVCQHCGGRLEQIAVIKDKAVAKAILASLKETTVFDPLKDIRGRGPPEGGAGHFPDSYDQRVSW